jgi:hypothetical protein
VTDLQIFLYGAPVLLVALGVCGLFIIRHMPRPDAEERARARKHHIAAE